MTAIKDDNSVTGGQMFGEAFAGEIRRYLTAVGVAFIALMVALEPDVGFSAPPAARLLYWTLQVATGFFVLQWMLYLLTRRLGASHLPSWFLVLLSGVLGAVVLTPVYWLIGEGMMEQWFGYPTRPDEAGTDLIDLTFTNPLLQEFVDIVGPVTTAWLLISLPRLHWLVPPVLHGPIGSEVVSQQYVEGGISTSEPATRARPTTHNRSAEPPRATWCERLPTELGTDVIAVASELQYLRVWTSRGCALILGALDDVESAGAANGLRVHRSWWVAFGHVVSVRRTATGAVCLMSDGRQVPVSRRRRAEVLARFGDGAQYRVAGSSEAVADTDLN